MENHIRKVKDQQNLISTKISKLKSEDPGRISKKSFILPSHSLGVHLTLCVCLWHMSLIVTGVSLPFHNLPPFQPVLWGVVELSHLLNENLNV